MATDEDLVARDKVLDRVEQWRRRALAGYLVEQLHRHVLVVALDHIVGKIGQGCGLLA